MTRPASAAWSGDCPAGDILDLVYDGTRFQLVSIFAGIASGGSPTLSPGDSVVVDPVTALPEQARKKVAVAGTNRTFVAGDRGKFVYRTNGGSAMVDTLPSSGLVAGWVTTVKNGHAAGQGALTINPAGGLLIEGGRPSSSIPALR
ncbi:hypothetical protein DW352_05215 [Pseudolabrys taiwanensis]|uniref:Uncharacterized protein n=1 Tax=Pseudolabrys taiwanensis TaxID=331696 RepID=A0A345ZSS2_9HYPH|nr:hypothetical protein [Pseudolabrys taiwanensis]AXK79969.1 hypothetical protein DW352_05215 [Pseudolabrys taiwanensis]